MNKSFIAMIIGGLLLIGKDYVPSPSPPIPPSPDPITEQDLWTKSSEVHRVLVSEVLESVAFGDFANDSEKLKHVQTEMTAAYRAAYTEPNKRIQEAISTGSEAVRHLSVELKDRKLE